MEDAKCENCKKWIRINNYKGYCAANPESPHEYTYEEDWCEKYQSWTEKDED